MKLKLLLLIFVLLTFGSKAQTIFSKQFQSPYISLMSVVNSSDSGFIACGDDAWIKVDRTGNSVWGKGGNIRNTRMCRTNNSCYVLVGNHIPSYDMTIIKINELGDTVWTSAVSLTNYAYPSKIIETADSSLMIIGVQGFGPAPLTQMFVMKVAYDGTLLWKKNYYGANYENKLTGIVEGPDHNFYLCGGMEDRFTSFLIKAVIIKITPFGDLLWNRVYNDTVGIHASMSDICLSGAGLMCCMSENTSRIVLKTDWDGNVLWSNRYNVNDGQAMLQNFVMGFQKKNENSFLLSCNSDLLSELDSTGQILSSFTSIWGLPIDYYITTFNNGTAHIAHGFSGSCLVLDDSLHSSICLIAQGIYPSTPISLLLDSVAFVVDSDGVQNDVPFPITDFTAFAYDNCPDVEGVQENTTYHNITIYPNPAISDFVFDFTYTTIPDLIIISDLNGRPVFNLKPFRTLERIEFSNSLSPGVYVCCFQYSDVWITKRVVVAR